MESPKADEEVSHVIRLLPCIEEAQELEMESLEVRLGTNSDDEDPVFVDPILLKTELVGGPPVSRRWIVPNAGSKNRQIEQIEDLGGLARTGGACHTCVMF